MLTPEKGERWGILGGTFDPVHKGHIVLAQNIRLKKNLTGILLIPTYNHPFKSNQSYASYENRVKMLRLATAENTCFLISEIEKEKNLSGFTIDTLKAVKIKYPGIDFFFIIGADNINRIKNWHKPDEIINEVKLIAGSRPLNGLRPSLELNNVSDDITGKIEFIDTPLVNISSSIIRRLFISGKEQEKLNEFVDDAVREFIIKNKLYQ